MSPLPEGEFAVSAAGEGVVRLQASVAFNRFKHAHPGPWPPLLVGGVE